MTDQEALQYARARLAEALRADDKEDIARWTEHVDYWRTLIALKAAERDEDPAHLDKLS